jgi:hypothetical protein
MSKQLIINADDFGRTRGVSDGIIRAHQEGIVTSTTAMMNMFGVAADLLKAKAEAPNLGLGVHLTFTAGRPLLPTEWVSSLIDERGAFLSQEAIIAKPTRLDTGELESELKAQIKTFQNATGQLPDHLDAHHFVHIVPQIFALYLDLADEFKLPIRIPFPRREADLSISEQSPQLIGDARWSTIETLIRADWELLGIHTAVRSTDRCWLNFHKDGVSLDSLLKMLDNLPGGTTELMTHPGLADEKLKTASTYNVQREKELAILIDPQVKARIQELGIELITYKGLSQ